LLGASSGRFETAMPFRPLAPVVALAVLTLPSGGAHAAVTEPNGTVVPVNVAAGGIYLGTWFMQQGETFDVVADAAAEPGAFSPLCDFSATFVLKDSGAQAGISWYNTTAGATGPVPEAEVYPIVPVGTAVGTVITSADIRTNPNYVNGLIGFVLVRNDDGDPNTPPTNTYYSEYRRNALCTGCTGAGMTPDYWKAALIYPSTVLENTFYLAFEDWGGASTTPQSWMNDGDFNDQVFRITGVACPGGGAPCDTGLPGICAPGLTECVAGGTLDCRQQVPEEAESCDGVDNDCNGDIDDGDLCPTGEVCDKGECVGRCSELAVTCDSTEVCSPEGFCVDAECADVTCPAGERCKGGTCKEPCGGVACPGGTVCLAGRCADPCVGVTCETGRVCDGGVCVPKCECQVCGVGLECQTDGRCVPTGCADVTCAAGQVCSGGDCVDACMGAVCPEGEKCEAGACVDACTGVTCEPGTKCVSGLCTDSCTGVHCIPGQSCVPGADNQGTCVAAADCTSMPCPLPGDQCVNGVCVNPCMACTIAQKCENGACVDRCQGVTCGAMEACMDGICVSTAPPATGGGTSAGAGGGAGTGGALLGGTGGTAGGSATGGATAGGMPGTGGSAPPVEVSGTNEYADPGCSCGVVTERRSSLWLLAAVTAGAAVVRRRRRSAA
jgi:MYXO-CTERM domain-containing protein